MGSLHLGCWDLALRWLSERLDNLAVIYRPAHNPQADALLNAARSANSRCRWISQFDARGILQSLRDGCGLVVMTDLYSQRSPLQVDVLGLATRFATGCSSSMKCMALSLWGKVRLHPAKPRADKPRMAASKRSGCTGNCT